MAGRLGKKTVSNGFLQVELVCLMKCLCCCCGFGVFVRVCGFWSCCWAVGGVDGSFIFFPVFQSVFVGGFL